MRSVSFLSLFFLVLSCSAQKALLVENTESDTTSLSRDTLIITSFNIQFLGSFKDRDHIFLADLLKSSTVVCIEELVAPPVNGHYPNGIAYKADPESTVFHQRMIANGFTWWLSDEDTGPKSHHTASNASEWWIVYYRADHLQADSMQRSYGFLSDTRCADSIFDRVPYAFPFNSVKGKLDFTLIPVHLRPGDRSIDRDKRVQELNGIYKWILAQGESNCDFFVLGDCNFKNAAETEMQLQEAANVFQQKLLTLNEGNEATNSKRYENAVKGRPYDHVFYSNCSSPELVSKSFQVIDLLSFTPEGKLENYIYEHDTFRTKYSDHLPIQFRLVLGKDND